MESNEMGKNKKNMIEKIKKNPFTMDFFFYSFIQGREDVDKQRKQRKIDKK